ncbi:MAG: MlaD family protein [Planctomycetaceae bacterium]|jgi:ABC-type transporter Mla subunit MlaD|nr:MlaD family protein [Planctomycetaceae bacterium]
MNTRHKELWVGVTVLTAIVSLMILAVYFGKGESVRFGDEYMIKVRFQRTPGITKRSPVYKNGVKIGVVANVELVDEDREVEITIRLPESRKIYTNEECRVRQTMITGDATLEFVKDINFKGEIELVGADSPPLVGRESGDILRSFTNLEGDLNKTLQVISVAVEHIGEFVDRANIIIGSREDAKTRHDRIDEVVAELQQTMLAIRTFSNQTNSLVNDPNLQKDIKQIINSLPAILNKSQTIFTNAESLLTDSRNFVKRGSESLGKIDRVIDNVTKITDKAQNDVPEIMESVKNTATKLQSLFDELITIVKAFQNSEGMLGKILKDPEAYQKLLLTLDNIEKITRDVNLLIRTDVKPISTNLRLFTDEIARDPSVFIRNLIKKRSPVKNGLPVWGDTLGSDRLLKTSYGYYADCGENFVEQFDNCTDKNIGNNVDHDFELPCCPVCYCYPCCCATGKTFTSLIPNCITTLFKNFKKIPAQPNCDNPNCNNHDHNESQYQPIDENGNYTKLNLSVENSRKNMLTEKYVEPTKMELQKGLDDVETDGVIINTDPRYPALAGKSEVMQMSFDKINNKPQHDKITPPTKPVFSSMPN